LISYLITDPAFYGSTPQALEVSLKHAIAMFQPQWVLFRDKQTNHYEELAQCAVAVAKAAGVEHQLIQNSDTLAKKIGATGVHVDSRSFARIEAVKRSGLLCVASTHNRLEIEASIDADYITYSPIYASPNKGKPKGLEDLNEKTVKMPNRVIALGGIVSNEQVEACRNAGAIGFASIRYFVKRV